MNIFRFVIPKSLVEHITLDSTIRQALEKMRYHRYTAIPVLDADGRYIGTLRNDDIFNYFLERGSIDFRDAEKVDISGIFSRSYSKPLFHNASMEELIEKVKEHNFVPVVDDRGCFVGIILRRDVLNYLSKCYSDTNGKQNSKGKTIDV